MMFFNNSYTYCMDRLKNEKTTGRRRKRERDRQIKETMDDARDVSTIKFPDLRTILNL